MGPKGEQTAFVYTTYIQQTPERVWQGRSQWRTFHCHADPAAGSEPARGRLLGGAVQSTGAR